MDASAIAKSADHSDVVRVIEKAGAMQEVASKRITLRDHRRCTKLPRERGVKYSPLIRDLAHLSAPNLPMRDH